MAFSKKAQHQCDADENLFLRFLELDPPPTDTQSRQSSLGKSNVNGRTPFTITKKLVKSPEHGFGFSIVWTHPPRIEKVEPVLSAEKSGILPGDYVIFIDKYNIVTMPELDILNLIRTQGNTLILEIFRRPTRQGSIKMIPPRLVTTAATNRQLSTDEESSIKPSQLWSSSAMSNTSLETTKKRLRLPQVAAISKEVSFQVLSLPIDFHVDFPHNLSRITYTKYINRSPLFSLRTVKLTKQIFRKTLAFFYCLKVQKL